MSVEVNNEQHTNFQIRKQRCAHGGEPWFVGNDVAAALGYGKGKSLANAVTNHVDSEDKGVTELMTPGGKQNVTIINESGLYSLILSSKLPTAKQLPTKRWLNGMPEFRN